MNKSQQMRILLLSVIILSTCLTVLAQEQLVKLYVTRQSALEAWESKDFTKLSESQAADGPWVKLILPEDTVQRFRQRKLTQEDKEAIAISMVTALGIVFPAPICPPEEPDKDDLRRWLRVPSEQMCRRQR